MVPCVPGLLLRAQVEGEGKDLGSSLQYDVWGEKGITGLSEGNAHRITPREGGTGIGMGQKGIIISTGCVATEECQDGKWLGKGSCEECALPSLERPLWGESREPGGSRTGQDKGPSGGGRGSRETII